MSQVTPTDAGKPKTTSHRFFAAFYERLSRGGSERSFMEPLRKEIIGQAQGLVLEIGAGNGLNFPFYDPAQAQRGQTIEPNTPILRYTRHRVKKAPLPLT